MPIVGIDFIIMLPLLLVWAIAAFRTGNYIRIIDKKRLRSRTWITLLIVGFAELLTLAKVATTTLIGLLRSWQLVEDRVILQLQMLVVPAVAVAIYSIPLFWRMARRGIEGVGELSPMRLVLPVQAALLGVGISTYLTFFSPGLPVQITDIVIVWSSYALGIVGLWFLHKQRAQAVRIEAQPKHGSGSMHLVRVLVAGLAVPVAILLAFVVSSQASMLPARMNMLSGAQDNGGSASASTGGMDMGGAQAVSVTDLRGSITGEPDKKFTLTAEKTTVQLSSGATVDAWTFNGQIPGPELRVRQGDVVEVTLVNKDIEEGVTVHWHGLDVPNAEDGVSGVTQDSVMPGRTFTYLFRADTAGTYWYHSHQQTVDTVARGLFGALVVEPAQGVPAQQDLTGVAHSWESSNGSVLTFGSADRLDRRIIAPGTQVRLRLINTESWPMTYALDGTEFKVAAIDGTDLNVPTGLTNTRLQVAAGGRYDLTFTMPATPVHLSATVAATKLSAQGLLLAGDENAAVSAIGTGPIFDPATYGSPAATPFGPDSKFDRNFTVYLDNRLGFYNGGFDFLYTINGQVFPNVHMLMVHEGDLVKMTIVSRSFIDHPMHLHGHHVLVLSRNGNPVTGSPWWVDTLNVAQGDTYEVAFRADNPGIWMDHCHNLTHAKSGMIMHLAYEGITTPFDIGKETINRPE